MKHLKIDDLASKVLRAQTDTDREKGYTGNFKLAVYIDLASFNDMKAEIRGPVSPPAMEFIQYQTVFEIPVYPIVCCKTHINIAEVKP